MMLARVGTPTRAESQRKGRITQQRTRGNIARSRKLREYLDQPEVEALIEVAPTPIARC